MASSIGEQWERLPGESEKAYEAFRIYRDMGLKRTNAAVCSQLSKSRQLISRWKKAYRWDERVQAYDNEMEREARREAVKNLKDMTSRHIQISMQLQKKALEALKDMDPSKMSIRDVREYLKMSTELERLNRYGATRSIDEEIDGGANQKESLADTIISAYRRRMEENE